MIRRTRSPVQNARARTRAFSVPTCVLRVSSDRTGRGDEVGVTGGPADAVTDPAHPEHAGRLAWSGTDRFDPHRVDLAAIDRRLERLR